MSAKVLVVDDEALICTMLERTLRLGGYEVKSETIPEDGLTLLKQESFDVLITDLHMSGMNGLELLQRARKIQPSCEVVMMTGYATVETAREALKLGAIDYITKPLKVDEELHPLLSSIIDSDQDEQEDPEDVDEVRTQDAWGDFVGRGKATVALLQKVTKIARSDVPVLLQGESGTGKEMISSLLHKLSRRVERPFIKVNCAALSETLLESELFGHTKGAFTGATSDRDGLFKAADGGTLLLDEIGEISRTFQPKLLRVLQDGEFHRVGEAQRGVKVDVRIIAATNRDLADAIRTGEFREDLYYRLNVVPLKIPTLHERIEDLPELLDHFIAQAARKHQGYKKVSFPDDLVQILGRYTWPGNIRELANAVESATVLAEEGEVRLVDLPLAIQDFARSLGEEVGGQTIPQAGQTPETLEEIEMRCILQSMTKTGFNRTRAADLLGVTRRTLSYRINKYELEAQLARLQAERPKATSN
ncbi:MAG: sigma-54 dependent transcriptional regulator [Myxococcota bacterium]|nr:sigma-54 dependent transcriptional regulator [Myxococcota bacterium]